MAFHISPPYFGAAYYPEDWSAETVDEDIRYMKQAGMNVMRMGEFAWKRMEPREGEYDFGWLHETIEKLARNGIATILCTPTATPPAWLTSKYPSVKAVDDKGVVAQHGARRHVCPNDPTYRRLCNAIVSAMAKAFADNEFVIGWQIDNEVYPHGAIGCCCSTCVDAFHRYLKKRFGTIQAFNDALCLELWSQAYDDFSQIPHPKSDGWHHPSLKALYAEFASDSLSEYIRAQADELHRHVRVPVGTDMMPFYGLDYITSHEGLDLVQFNHYHETDTLWRVTLWYNYIRTIKPAPFWNTETATCWNGSVTANLMKPSGFCRVNSWLPIALGGEANLYWLWRSHWAGHELMHGSVLSSSGRPLYMYDEVCELGRAFEKCSDFLNQSPVRKPSVAIHMSSKAYFTVSAQPNVNGLKYADAMERLVYKPIFDAGIPVDIIDPGADLEGYSIVLSPFLPDLGSEETRARIRAFIEQGGVWIVGPLSDNRDENGAKFTDKPFRTLEDWAGVYTRWQAPCDAMKFRIAWPDGEYDGEVWYDAFDLADAETRAVATYVDGPFAGKAAAVCRRVGKGQICALGSWPGGAYLELLKRFGAKPAANRSETVMAIPRKGSRSGMVVIETRNQPGWIELEKPMYDLIEERSYEAGVISLSPFQTLCLAEEN